MKKLLVMFAILVFTTGSAFAAAEWNFYGSARVNTTYTEFDNDSFSNISQGSALGFPSGFDTENYEQRLYGNARIGAKVKVNDEITGRFEYGALGSNANIRILWGEWNFGAGSLGVGQHYTPLLFPYSNQTYSVNGLNKGDHSMSTFGMLYGSRKAMIRLKFGNFQIAAVEPKTLFSLDTGPTGLSAMSTVGLYTAPSVESKFPSIQAKYQYDFDKGHVAVAGGYQTFELGSNSVTHDIDSYLLGIGGRLDIGAAYLKGNVFGGQNVGNLVDILVNGALFSTPASVMTGTLDGDGFGFAQWDGIAVNDKDALAGLIVAGYKIREGLYLEAGYGYVRTDLDVVGAEKDDVETMYIQSTIFLAKGVFLTPELGRVDMKQDNDPVVTYGGIKWQINF